MGNPDKLSLILRIGQEGTFKWNSTVALTERRWKRNIDLQGLAWSMMVAKTSASEELIEPRFSRAMGMKI